MGPYFMIWAFCCLVAVSDSFNFFGRSTKSSAIIILIGLVFFAGMRWETGHDWQNYTAFYESVEDLPSLLHGRVTIFAGSVFEFGFKLVLSSIKALGANVQLLFFLFSLANAILLYKIVVRYSSYPALSLLLYYSMFFFELEMAQVRGSFAILLFMFSLEAAIAGRLLKFLSIILFAAFFHRSAGLMVFFYPLIRCRQDKHFLLFFLIIGNILFLTGQGFLRNIIQHFSGLLAGPLRDHFLTYANDNFFGGARSFSFGYFERNLLALCFIVFAPRNRREIDLNTAFLNMFVINVCLSLIFSDLPMLGDRIRAYFAPALIFLIPNLLRRLVDSSQRLIGMSAAAIISLSHVFFYLQSPTNQMVFLPYQNYLVDRLLLESKSTGGDRFQRALSLAYLQDHE